jgi:hypothetical protein
VHADEATLRELMWTHARRSDVAAVDRTIALLVASGVAPDERHEKARAWASGETPRRLEDAEQPAAEGTPASEPSGSVPGGAPVDATGGAPGEPSAAAAD